jgi:hypothetical protein
VCAQLLCVCVSDGVQLGFELVDRVRELLNLYEHTQISHWGGAQIREYTNGNTNGSESLTW